MGRFLIIFAIILSLIQSTFCYLVINPFNMYFNGDNEAGIGIVIFMILSIPLLTGYVLTLRYSPQIFTKKVFKILHLPFILMLLIDIVFFIKIYT